MHNMQSRCSRAGPLHPMTDKADDLESLRIEFPGPIDTINYPIRSLNMEGVGDVTPTAYRLLGA